MNGSSQYPILVCTVMQSWLRACWLTGSSHKVRLIFIRRAIQRFAFNGKPEDNFLGSKQPAEHEDGVAPGWPCHVKDTTRRLLPGCEEMDADKFTATERWEDKISLCHVMSPHHLATYGRWQAIALGDILVVPNTRSGQWMHCLVVSFPHGGPGL